MTDDDEVSLIDRDRHCAYCLKHLPPTSAKLCGKCLRRAYCSRECQTTDWSPKEGTQGHKNWCRLKCGEEDIDWEIKPVPGKGLGVIAKRFIPSKYRILIDARRSKNHPAIYDLSPIGGTLAEKITRNSFTDDIGESTVFLRMARLNHDCNRNAGHHYDADRSVKVVFAERDIKAGEEITISYVPMFYDRVFEHRVLPPSETRSYVSSKWGIECKDSACICRNQEIFKLVKECVECEKRQTMLISCLQSVRKGASPKYFEAMKSVRQLVKNLDTIGASWFIRMIALGHAAEFAVMRRSTLDEAKKYLRESYEIRAALFHPDADKVRESKLNADNPQSCENYLMLE